MKKFVGFIAAIVLGMLMFLPALAAEDTLLTQESIAAQDIRIKSPHFSDETKAVAKRYLDEKYPGRDIFIFANLSGSTIIFSAVDSNDSILLSTASYRFAESDEVYSFTMVFFAENEGVVYKMDVTGFLCGIIENPIKNQTIELKKLLSADPRLKGRDFSKGFDKPNSYSGEVTEVNLYDLPIDIGAGDIHPILNIGGDKVIFFYRSIEDYEYYTYHDGTFIGQRMKQGSGGTHYAVADIKKMEIVAEGKLNGSVSGYSFSTGGRLRVNTNTMNYEEPGRVLNGEYFVNYISLTDYTAVSHTVENFSTIKDDAYVGSHKLTHENGGIFELLADGTRRELLPPAADFDNTDENADWNVYYSRQYKYFHTALDEHRFIYTISGVEAIPGFGVYDFRTGTAAYIENSRDKLIKAVTGNKIYSAGTAWDDFAYFGLYVTDLNTLQTREVYAEEGFFGDFDVSDDGKYAAILDSKALMYYNLDGRMNNYPIFVMDLASGKIIREYFISSLSHKSQCERIEFLDGGKLYVSCGNLVADYQTVFVIDTGLDYFVRSPGTGDAAAVYLVCAVIPLLVTITSVARNKKTHK